MLLWVLRGCYLALILGVGLIFMVNYPETAPFVDKLGVLLGTLLFGGLVLLTDVLVKNKQITTIAAIYFGLLIGLLIGTITAKALDPFLTDWFGQGLRRTETMKLFITIVCCYICISTLLQTKDEFR